jgi:rubrerythrin
MATRKKNATKNNAQTRESNAEMTPQIDLIYQSLETEMGGVEIYTNALECVQNEDLKEEWENYLEQTKRHVEVVRELCESLGLDPEADTPGRQVVRSIGLALVKAIQMAAAGPDPKAAEIVAAECVMLAESKDHSNWELLSKLAENAEGEEQEALQAAADEVEDEEDVHLYHGQGWARELWMDALGLDAQLPPPEEEEDVQDEEEAVQVRKQENEEQKRKKSAAARS